MFCTECGKQIPDNSIICTYCGANVQDDAPTPAAPEERTDILNTDVDPFFSAELPDDKPADFNPEPTQANTYTQNNNTYAQSAQTQQPYGAQQFYDAYQPYGAQPSYGAQQQSYGTQQQPYGVQQSYEAQQQPYVAQQPKPAQAPYPAPVQPAYPPSPAANYKKEIPKNDKVFSTGGFLGVKILFCIPLIGLIVAFIWAFSKKANVNLRNYSRAYAILCSIGILLLVAAYIVFFVVLYNDTTDWLWDNGFRFLFYNPVP